jgi:plastocyanin domain-containing protein
MSPLDWSVILGAATAIGWINWYFFAAERDSATAALVPAAAGAAGAVQEATVLVKGGYTPAVVRARAGQPLRLAFDRQETASCSEEVVLPAFGVRRFLPADARTVVELTPTVPGTYEFTCGMGMLRGSLVVE